MNATSPILRLKCRIIFCLSNKSIIVQLVTTITCINTADDYMLLKNHFSLA